jgi:hypothetical protein
MQVVRFPLLYVNARDKPEHERRGYLALAAMTFSLMADSKKGSAS